jgi:hypothetical protein
LSRNTSLTPEIIQEFGHSTSPNESKWYWEQLSKNDAVTPEIIREFEKKTDDCRKNWNSPNNRWSWDWLSVNAKLTSEIITEFAGISDADGKWNWPLLSSNLGITLEIIKKFSKSTGSGKHSIMFNDRWDWSALSKNPALTPEIIREFPDKIKIKLIDKDLLNITAKELNLNPSALDSYIYYIINPTYINIFLKNFIQSSRKKYYSNVALTGMIKYTIPDLAKISLNFL